MNRRARVVLALVCGMMLPLAAEEVRRYDCPSYSIDICECDGVTYPRVQCGTRALTFAYRTDGYAREGERQVVFHGMKSHGYRGEITGKGLKASFLHDLHLMDGEKTGEKIGVARTEIRCVNGLVGVQTTLTPAFPGRFAFRHDYCFSQVVVFPDFDHWIGTTIVTTDERGDNHMNLLMPHERFVFGAWGLNARDLRKIVFGNVPDVLSFSAGKNATLILNHYVGGMECGAALRHPHPRRYPTAWTEPMVYRYAFRFNEEGGADETP